MPVSTPFNILSGGLQGTTPSGGSAVGTTGIAVTQVAYGAGTNLIKGEASFAYDDTNDALAVKVILLNGVTLGTGLLQFPVATTSAGGITFGADTNFFRAGAGVVSLTGTANAAINLIGASGSAQEIVFIQNSTEVGRISFSGTTSMRFATGVNITALTIDPTQNLLFSSGVNGQSLNIKHLTELTTIAASPTTDTVIQMPAGSIVLSVSVRVTVVIPTATNFTVGDSGSAARFSTAAVSSAATSTDVGTKAGAYYNASALSVRITPDLTPAANTGRVRVTIAYLDVTVPTS
jgi:hypothetical protein